MNPPGQTSVAEAWSSQSVRSFVRSFDSYKITLYWKQLNIFLWKLAQVVHRPTGKGMKRYNLEVR